MRNRKDVVMKARRIATVTWAGSCATQSLGTYLFVLEGPPRTGRMGGFVMLGAACFPWRQLPISLA